jgi:hypothetical protein
MRVFISHQKADSVVAGYVANYLHTYHGIEYYLDVVDDKINKDGPDLAEYVRDQLANCDHLIAIVSEATSKSWWVPWEIGIATEKDFPLATYSTSSVDLPEYLHKWPYLRSTSDLNKYALQAQKMTRGLGLEKFESVNASAQRRRSATKDFYRDLRADLGQ